MPAIPRVFIGFGANVGDREQNLLAAQRGLEVGRVRDVPRGPRTIDLDLVHLHERSLRA